MSRITCPVDGLNFPASREAVHTASRVHQSATNRQPAHTRHNGIMIDASFLAGSGGRLVEFYVVEGSHGQFYSLDVAREIAEAISGRRAAIGR